jgi:hypothetical protein
MDAAESAFAGFRYPPDVIMMAVRWYLRYNLSFRNAEELTVDQTLSATAPSESPRCSRGSLSRLSQSAAWPAWPARRNRRLGGGSADIDADCFESIQASRSPSPKLRDLRNAVRGLDPHDRRRACSTRRREFCRRARHLPNLRTELTGQVLMPRPLSCAPRRLSAVQSLITGSPIPGSCLEGRSRGPDCQEWLR